MNELALFAGVGGGILGGKLLGWRTVCAVERDAYCASVLAQRQNDGHLEPFPIWSDLCSFDGKPWRGLIDVVSGGFPCQDISVAGKGAGIKAQRSGLWKEMFRIVCEVQPKFVFVENSPALTSRGLGTVLGDLASVGFDAEWGVLGSNHTDGFCKRERIWILASGNSKHGNQSREREVPRNISKKTKAFWEISTNRETHIRLARSRYTSRIFPLNGGGCNEFSIRVDRLRGVGNAQDPTVARLAFIILKERLKGSL